MSKVKASMLLALVSTFLFASVRLAGPASADQIVYTNGPILSPTNAIVSLTPTLHSTFQDPNAPEGQDMHVRLTDSATSTVVLDIVDYNSGGDSYVNVPANTLVDGHSYSFWAQYTGNDQSFNTVSQPSTTTITARAPCNVYGGYSVCGAIRDEFLASGGESRYGDPTGAQYNTSDGIRQDFNASGGWSIAQYNGEDEAYTIHGNSDHAIDNGLRVADVSGAVSTDQAQSDGVPSGYTAVNGQKIRLLESFGNFYPWSTRVSYSFTVDCDRYPYTDEVVISPTAYTVVPGDPQPNSTGKTPLAFVSATMTLPSDCMVPHQSSSSQGSALVQMHWRESSSTYYGSNFPQLSPSSSAGPVLSTGTIITLYRVVGPNKANDIRSTGRYRIGPNGAMGKYFYPTREQAENLAQTYEDAGYGTYSVTTSTIDEGALVDTADEITVAGEGDALFLIGDDVLGSFGAIEFL